MSNSIIMPVKDIKLLLSLVPDWVKIVPKGLEPTFYGTLTYEGDMKVKKRIDRITQAIEKIDNEPLHPSPSGG